MKTPEEIKARMSDIQRDIDKTKKYIDRHKLTIKEGNELLESLTFLRSRLKLLEWVLKD